MVLRQGSKALIAGGHERNLGIGQSFEVEMYDCNSHSFEGFGCLDKKRALAQGTELADGCAFISGNHKGNDALELFDGHQTFLPVKEVSSWRFCPYVLRISGGDALVFGTVWRGGRTEPCDTVDRLKGPPFTVSLLKTWMPMTFDQTNHADAAFTGNTEANDYSYLIVAQDHN